MSESPAAHNSGLRPHFYTHAAVLGVLYALPFLVLLLIGLPLGALIPEYLIALAFVVFAPAFWVNAVFLRQIVYTRRSLGISPPGAMWVLVAPALAAALLAACLLLFASVAVRVNTLFDDLIGRSESRPSQKSIPVPPQFLAPRTQAPPPTPRPAQSGVVVGESTAAQSEVHRIYVARTSLMYYSAPPTGVRQAVETQEGPVFFRVLSTNRYGNEDWYQIRVTPVRGQQFLAWISDNALRIANPEQITEQQAQTELARLRGEN